MGELLPFLSLAHLIAKPEEHQDEEILKERHKDEDHADQDPGYERAESVRGRDASAGAVVQVDRHQKQGEEKAKPDQRDRVNINNCFDHHLPGTASTRTAKLTQLTITISPEGTK